MWLWKQSGDAQKSIPHIIQKIKRGSNAPIVVSVDMGGVVRKEMSPVLTLDEVKNVPFIAGAMECLPELIASTPWFFHITRVMENYDHLTVAWLNSVDYFNRMGLNPDQYIICRTRQDKKKVCQEVGVTHHIDDRLEAMVGMQGITLIAFNPVDWDEYPEMHNSVIRVESWAEICHLLGKKTLQQ